MEPTALKLRYRSIDQFLGHLRQLSTGRLFIPTELPLPVETTLRLVFLLPETHDRLTLDMRVIASVDRASAEQQKRACGMLLGTVGNPPAAVEELARQMRSLPALNGLVAATPVHPASSGTPCATSSAAGTGADPWPTPRPSGPVPPPRQRPSDQEEPALSMGWIRSAVAQAEAARERELEAPPPAHAAAKKELSPADRERIKPVGEFVMDLTKAMMRSGYYAADHPGSHNAKKGLYEALHRCLRDSPEITITHQQDREKNEILITGILEEPVNVRAVVGAGMAELFVPKLSECMARKALMSVAIKKSIPPDHFEGFIDVMSDPTADRGENAKVGAMLTHTLLERGITEISCVFMDDIIVLEKNLPWRVEMAIQRLAKDLKVLPMFKGESDESIKQLKLQIIQDILRPLKHPEFLKDLIINCYVIAQHVNTIQEEDIEKVIIEAFPLEALLPTSNFIFAELNRLKESSAADPENPFVKRRFAGVKRILKWVAGRVVLTDQRGARRFLQALHEQEILCFDELPPDVQYVVNTERMAKDVAAHIRHYGERMLQPATAGDAAALLKCFRRVIPLFLEQGQIENALRIARAVKTAGSQGGLLGKVGAEGQDPLEFIFGGRADELRAVFENSIETQPRLMEELLDLLGPLSIEVLWRVVCDSQLRPARKAAMAVLGRKGACARELALSVLEDPVQKWYLTRNALILLRDVAEGAADIARVRPLVNHIHPRVRNEALNTLIALEAPEAEVLILKALDDPDEKMRWRAANALAELSPLSAETMERLLTRLDSEPPADKTQAERHLQRTARLIQALGGMKSFHEPERVEAALLEIGETAAGRRKSFLERLRKSEGCGESVLLGAVISALGSIGTQRARPFLTRTCEGKSAHAPAARKALELLEARLGAV